MPVYVCAFSVYPTISRSMRLAGSWGFNFFFRNSSRIERSDTGENGRNSMETITANDHAQTEDAGLPGKTVRDAYSGVRLDVDDLKTFLSAPKTKNLYRSLWIVSTLFICPSGNRDQRNRLDVFPSTAVSRSKTVDFTAITPRYRFVKHSPCLIVNPGFSNWNEIKKNSELATEKTGRKAIGKKVNVLKILRHR